MSPPMFAGTSSPEGPTAVSRLIVLRWGLLAGEIAAIVGVPVLLDIPLPRVAMLAVVALQALGNHLVARRLARAGRFGDGELVVQLVADIVALAVLMFLSGGAANPLISLLLLPVAVAALALPARPVMLVTALAIAAYSVLNIYYLPLPIANAERAARLHLAGMWFTFVLSAAMLAWFVVRMKASIRARDAELGEAREKALRDERVVALGALAAGAAHELSTPLATMTVIAGELERDATLPKAAREDIAVLHRQVTACKDIISGLAERAGAERLDSATAVQGERWLADVFARWREMRPRVDAELRLVGVPPQLTFIADATLEQGLLNLFNNAANAGKAVRVTASGDESGFIIKVCDDGPGFEPHILEQAGRKPFPVHAAGSGIGLFLAHAAITRLGGELQLLNVGGGVARVRLPATSH
ncbi:MAG: sensor histidine kinase [Gammaproteobacteria bacterium]|nr:sensor histidine kinase [Gammaproteobacteria bacterium]MBU1415218.1 sensor histidine kinase [Gammaproteobacteria bacterium]